MDTLKKIWDLIPYIRDGGAILQWAVIVWLTISATLAVVIVWDALRRPQKLPNLTVDLTPNQYIPDRQISLKGGGLAESATLEVQVFSVPNSGALRTLVPQAEQNLIRLPDGNWNINWITFNVSGLHEISISVVKKGVTVAALPPYKIYVTPWVTLPAAAAPDKVDARASNISHHDSGTIDLSSHTSIVDQGQEGSVVGIALANTINITLSQAGIKARVSSRYIYERAQRLDGLQHDAAWEEGAHINTAILIAEKIGVPPEEIWPYIPMKRALPENKSWDSLDKIALKDGYRTHFQKLRNMEDIQNAIAASHPVIAGINIHENFFSAPAGIIKPPEGPAVGLHAIVIVGYDEAQRRFKFANCWGKFWGDKGFGYIDVDTANILIEKENIWSAMRPAT